MKYQNEHDEYVASAGNVYDMQGGDVESPTGWFASVTLMPDTEFAESREKAAARHYGTPYLLVHESNEGFVTVVSFEDQAKRDERFAELDRAYALYEARINPDDAVAAIAAYRAAALWTVLGDEPSIGFSEEAQRKMRDDVLDYITQNADNIRAYLEVMGEEWGQAGHDFWLLRNGKQDLADRGVAGSAVEAVIESAHAWGGQRFGIGEDDRLITT